MPNKVLIVYASHNGSTKGVAEAIGQTLSADGFDTDVKPVKDVKSLSDYNAVILGSAIQSGKWLPEAMDFIKQNKPILNQLKVATFQVCMTLAMSKAEQYREFVRNWTEPVRSMISLSYEGSFSGALDVKNISSFSDRLKFRLSVLFGVWKEGDHRDWEAIKRWTKEMEKIL